jgi:hypothetical protein
MDQDGAADVMGGRIAQMENYVRAADGTQLLSSSAVDKIVKDVGLPGSGGIGWRLAQYIVQPLLDAMLE